MAKVTAKYQITIPKGIREEMGIFPGCDVEIKKEKGMYVLFADLKKDIRKKWRGKFKNGKTSDEYIEEIRGRADSGKPGRIIYPNEVFLPADVCGLKKDSILLCYH